MPYPTPQMKQLVNEVKDRIRVVQDCGAEHPFFFYDLPAIYEGLTEDEASHHASRLFWMIWIQTHLRGSDSWEVFTETFKFPMIILFWPMGMRREALAPRVFGIKDAVETTANWPDPNEDTADDADAAEEPSEGRNGMRSGPSNGGEDEIPPEDFDAVKDLSVGRYDPAAPAPSEPDFPKPNRKLLLKYKRAIWGEVKDWLKSRGKDDVAKQVEEKFRYDLAHTPCLVAFRIHERLTSIDENLRQKQ